MRAHARLLPAALLALAACRGGDASENVASSDAPTNGGTLVVASAGEPDLLFPALTQSMQGRHVNDQVFDRLAEIGDSLNTVGDAGFTPRLARRWTWSADSLSVAFELDPRARWHDGRPVRAEDVRFTWQVTVDPAVGSPVAPIVANVDSVQVRDSLTAVVWYKARTPERFYDFVYHLPIVPAHVYATLPRATLRTAEAMRAPVGSGRFRFARWVPQQRLEIVADTANFRGRARLDRVVYVLAKEYDVALARLQSGEADYFETVTAEHAAKLGADSTLRLVRYAGLQTNFLQFNLVAPGGAPHPVLGDRAVRVALSQAVDRGAMLRNVFDTLGTLAVGPLPGAHPAAAKVALPAFDLAAAQRTLDSAGWRAGPDGVRAKDGRRLAFRMLVPVSSRVRASYAVLLQQAFERVGARVTIESVDFPTFMQRYMGRDFDAAVTGIGMDPSPSTMRQYWASASAAPGGSNVGGYRSGAFDATLDSALAAVDPASARTLAHRAQQLLADDAPAIWLYDPLMLAAGHRRLRTAGLRADEWWAGLADWWIPAGERLPRDAAPAVAVR